MEEILDIFFKLFVSLFDTYNWLPDVLSMFVAIIALWQSSKSVSISNRQSIFEKRMSTYTVVNQLFATYQVAQKYFGDNKATFDELVKTPLLKDLWEVDEEKKTQNTAEKAMFLKDVACSMDLLWRRNFYIVHYDWLHKKVSWFDITHPIYVRAARKFLENYADTLLDLRSAIISGTEPQTLDDHKERLQRSYEVLNGGIFARICKPGTKLNKKMKTHNRLRHLKDTIRL